MFENAFVRKLLTLQQDGSGAISAPSNWAKADPLLRVETPALQYVRNFADKLLAPSKTELRWHFLVGGPGNGKSLAVRELAVKLLQSGARITDASGTALDELPVGRVPAVLEVRLQDGTLAARIAQDASVVSDPFTDNPDPPAELRALMASCASDGCGLVACTNRGVLERAAADAGADEFLAAALRGLVEAGGELGEQQVKYGKDQSILISASPIDSGSLFSGQQPPIADLVQQAIDARHWDACKDCECAALCPFQLNRRSLLDDAIRGNVLRIIEDAELLDGQPLVFREAGALLSLFLAGCAADYADGSPCAWVERNIEEQRWFALAARRLHMSIFSSHSPLGFDLGRSLHQAQMLRLLMDRANYDAGQVLEGPPSTQVGIPRLLGADGQFKRLDITLGVVPKQLEANGWDEVFGGDEATYPSALEKKCLEVWRRLDTAFENEWPEAGDCMAELSRWRSAHTLRSGVIELGLHAWRSELGAYREAIGIPAMADLVKKRELKELVKTVLDSDDGSTRIGNNLVLRKSPLGEVDVDWNKSHSTRSLCLLLKGGSHSVTTKLSATAFIWLVRRYKAPLSEKTFPMDWLESARDAIGRAAAASCYSKMGSGELEVKAPGGIVFELMWDEGEVLAKEVDRG